MENEAKKTPLRMIPYGLYVLTAANEEGEVENAGLNKESEGRPDEAILWLKDLGENIFYGG
jgi:hypothetical protein